MTLFNEDGSVYAWNHRRPRQNDLYRPQCKTFFGALRYEVAFLVDGPDEWFPAVVQEIAGSCFSCAEFTLEHVEALFSEEGVVWYGVVLRWVGAPWYEFAGGGGVGREVPGDIIRDVSWVEDRFVTSGVVKMGCRDGCVDVWIVPSGGVGCCCWLGDGISSETKEGTGRCQLLDVGNRVSVRSWRQ